MYGEELERGGGEVSLLLPRENPDATDPSFGFGAIADAIGGPSAPHYP